ncbi:MaoC/PaaZ C-terminal domain-containing protein [Hoeflea sp.]|uniref:MaoC/PaaZ C-terminal domain-containing protein n=1 Tax=Hoeflea sp. TaxID=1940281 RepID=UPI00199E32E0|nr:MaoC/PaaZ C-terminal domain-containing protein [Hoeflea sp.]MBC7285078.1 MaoC family dehydratase N-terminal domain-containing protein [Hoeflea sp.]
MSIDYDRLLNWKFPEVRQRISQRDAILYALGIGLGSDPLDENQLRFVYEKSLQVLPTYPVVLGYPGFWLKDPGTGVDWVRLVHGEQGIQIHRPLPSEGEVIGRTRVTGIVDKGAGKGALVYTERELTNAENGELLATLTNTTFCRGDGGFGGPTGPVKPAPQLPQRPADASIALPTLSQAALLYRLNGDFNPLHAEPAVARAAGFDRPILHGLATMGVAGHALLRVMDYDPSALSSISVRFSAPVFPGETLTTDVWKEGGELFFRTQVASRNVLVLNNGHATLRA